MEIVYFGFFLFIVGIAGLIIFDKIKEDRSREAARRQLLKTVPKVNPKTLPNKSRSKPVTKVNDSTNWLDRLEASATEQVNRQLQEQTATVEDLIAQIERIKKKL